MHIEEVGKARGSHTEVNRDPLRPSLLKGNTVLIAVVQMCRGAGVNVEARGEDDDVEAKMVWDASIVSENKMLGIKLFREWLEPALADGILKPKPDPEIVGKGLEAIQEGLDMSSQGMSDKKLVVSLE
jgi:hypothetical protein